MKEIVVALSGTLETFSLPDVLRLLSSTKKTGLLALDGDRGRGRIWVRDGAIVAADADRAAHEQIEGVAFELLRFEDARFEFESGAETATSGRAHEVDDVLADAGSRLEEWREIEAVVPSLDVWVRMVSEIDLDRTVTADQWRVLAQVGTGASGHALADRLAQGEYDVCRQLRDLVQDGMVELGETPVSEAMPAWASPVEASFVEPALEPEDVSALGADLASFVAVGTVPEPVVVDFREPDPEIAPEAVTAPDHLAEAPTAFEAMGDTGDTSDDAPADADEPTVQAEPSDDGDFLSQLSQLSPKAAAAVEATWAGDAAAPDADEQQAAVEPTAPQAETGPAGDDIDQNLLLRFLSSAKS